MQTATDWLIEQLIPKDQHEGIMDIIKEANKMFEQQIMDAWSNGWSNGHIEINQYEDVAERYYNETYK